MKSDFSQDQLESDWLDEERGLDLKGYFFKLLPHWYWFVISATIALSIAFVFNRYATPMYPVSGTLMIQDKQSEGNAILEELGASLESSRNIDNDIGILSSYSLLGEVIDSLGLTVSYYRIGNIKTTQLYRSSPILVEFSERPTQVQNLKLRISNMQADSFYLTVGNSEESNQTDYDVEIEIKGMVLKIVKSPQHFRSNGDEGPVDIYFRDRLSCAKSYKTQVSIKQQKRGASIIELSSQTANPALMSDFIDVLMTKYIARELNQKNETSVRTIQFIDSQLGGIQEELFAAESQLETFRSKNKIVDISQAGINAFEQLQALENQLATAQIEKRYFEYLQEYLKSLPEGEVVTPAVVGVQEASLNALIARLNELHSQQVALQSSASEFNPQLSTLNAQIRRVVETINGNVKLLIESVDLRIKDFETRIGLNEQELNLLPGNERKLVNIQRRFSLNENLYVYLLEKKAEASIVRAGNVPTSSIVDNAVQFSQVTPKKKRNYMIAAFLGLALPLGILIVIWYFDNTVSSMEELTFKTKLPVIGSIALNKYESDLVLKEHPRSMEAESFRTVRSNLRFLQNGKQGGHVLMLTSFLSGEGKTFTALNLASSFALANYKTLLISCDLRKKEKYEGLGKLKKHGMIDFLIEDKSLKEIIQSTDMEHLDFINSGPIAPNPNELLLGADLAGLFDYTRENYDYIIVDTSPVGIVSDPIEISKYVDTTLFITRQGKTPKDAIAYVNETVGKGLLKNVSIVFNAVDFNKMSYRYGYKNGYKYTKYFDKTT